MDRRTLIKVSTGAALASVLPAVAFAALPVEVVFRVVLDEETKELMVTRVGNKDIDPIHIDEYCKQLYPHLGIP